MRYFKICPRCGAHLDPDEKCDCEEVMEVGGERQVRDSGNVYRVSGEPRVPLRAEFS